MPQLIKLLKDASFVKLENTADLIYPGANKFYGHGWIVNYDIDWISSRAAWRLEEITFQNFGYQEQMINEDQVMKLHRHNYQSYLKSGSHSVNLKGKTPRQIAVVYRQLLADSVSRWWYRNQNTWTRYNALKEALASRDELRQSLALHFLRFEKTKCEDLTLDNYQKELSVGKTLEGIHHDDIMFILDNNNLKEWGSEGQRKNAIISFKLAEINVIYDIKGYYPILILDDLFSELDKEKITNLLGMLDRNVQTFITTTDLKNISKKVIKDAKKIKVCDGVI